MDEKVIAPPLIPVVPQHIHDEALRRGHEAEKNVTRLAVILGLSLVASASMTTFANISEYRSNVALANAQAATRRQRLHILVYKTQAASIIAARYLLPMHTYGQREISVGDHASTPNTVSDENIDQAISDMLWCQNQLRINTTEIDAELRVTATAFAESRMRLQALKDTNTANLSIIANFIRALDTRRTLRSREREISDQLQRNQPLHYAAELQRHRLSPLCNDASFIRSGCTTITGRSCYDAQFFTPATRRDCETIYTTCRQVCNRR